MGLQGATSYVWGYTLLYGHFRELNDSASYTLLHGAKGELHAFVWAPPGDFPFCMGLLGAIPLEYGLQGTIYICIWAPGNLTLL